MQGSLHHLLQHRRKDRGLRRKNGVFMPFLETETLKKMSKSHTMALAIVVSWIDDYD